ncbi:MAG: type I methionyl aminopeptidase [Anaerolineae bacterium]|jgi:methionyl aminopeptidase|nr:type I methionyl aminopeptidase [Anaerolineae bacterium]
MVWERTVVLKTAEEIEIMQAAGHINAHALQEVRRLIRPGATTAELDRAAEEVIRDHGAVPAFLGYPGPTPYPGTINASIDDELVHGLPKDRPLQEGEIISIDCGTIFEEFVADSAFTMAVGEVSKAAQRLMDVTREALAVGIERMRPGNRVGDVSAAIQDYVEGYGYNVPREYSGHGVGRKMHEGPQVPNYGLPGRGLALRPGITIAIEPMVLAGEAGTKVLEDGWTVCSVDGSLTAHFEHSVAVTDDDPLILTRLADEQ